MLGLLGKRKYGSKAKESMYMLLIFSKRDFITWKIILSA